MIFFSEEGVFFIKIDAASSCLVGGRTTDRYCCCWAIFREILNLRNRYFLLSLKYGELMPCIKG